MTWYSRSVRQSAATLGGVPGMIFQITSIMGFQNQEIGVEGRDIEVAEEDLGVSLLPLFGTSIGR